MFAITIRQPWAWSIIHADPRKDVENRSKVGMWRRAEGQRVAIHAGQQTSERGFEHPIYRASLAALPGHVRHRIDARGAIIGTAHCFDVHPAERGCCDSPWAEYTYRDAYGHTVRDDIAHLILDDARACDPIPCRGALGLWTVPTDVAFELEAARR